MISTATAYCNNEVGYVAWTLGARMPGCLGFEVTRVHVLDVFEHYRFRAVQTDMESVGKSSFSGFLDTTDGWQDGYLEGSRSALGRYLARGFA